jgi:phosphoribosylaminoimidazole-succinocarboxamide synthase
MSGLFARRRHPPDRLQAGVRAHFEGDAEITRILLADEISPDSCRLWDFETGEKLDKDRFRRDLGGVTEAYAEVARRLGIIKESGETDNVVSFNSGK